MNNVTIGIVRGLLYYKYKYLLNSFFRELNINILVSPMFDDFKYCKNLYLNNYLSSIKYLNGKVDYILNIRIDDDNMCFYFNSLYDIVNSKFDINSICLNIDKKSYEELSFIKLGEELGFSKNFSLNAYKNAKLEEYKQNKINYLLDVKRLKKRLKKVLIIGYEYIYNNENIKSIIYNLLKDNNIELINSNNLNPDRYNDIKSYINELINNIKILKDRVDGIIIFTTYPSVYNNIDFYDILDNNILKIHIDENFKIDVLKENITNFLEKIKMENEYE